MSRIMSRRKEGKKERNVHHDLSTRRAISIYRSTDEICQHLTCSTRCGTGFHAADVRCVLVEPTPRIILREGSDLRKSEWTGRKEVLLFVRKWPYGHVIPQVPLEWGAGGCNRAPTTIASAMKENTCSTQSTTQDEHHRQNFVPGHSRFFYEQPNRCCPNSIR